jgi:sulfur carrier protein
MSDTSPKTLILNGTPISSAAATLALFLSEQGYGAARVATAVNGDFVPERQRAATIIKAGDRVEVVSARQGG